MAVAYGKTGEAVTGVDGRFAFAAAKAALAKRLQNDPRPNGRRQDAQSG